MKQGYQGVDAHRAAGWHPRGEKSEHRDSNPRADQHERIARLRFVPMLEITFPTARARVSPTTDPKTNEDWRSYLSDLYFAQSLLRYYFAVTWSRIFW